MKFKLNDKERQKVELSAVQQVIQAKYQEAVIARANEIEKELSELTDTLELTAEDIFNRYIESPTVLTPTAGLMVPKH